MTYKDLKKLEWEQAVRWLGEDVRDDFFPDPIRYRDISRDPAAYAAANRFKLPQFDRDPFDWIPIPKATLLSRDGIHLPYSFRLAYTAIFAKLFPFIAPELEKGAYSYRIYEGIDLATGGYPFPSAATTQAWLKFNNDFRRAIIEAPDDAWVIITDLSCFYEHVSVARLTQILQNLIPSNAQNETAGYLQLLGRMLQRVSRPGGYGIPQNYDPSSFFCSAFLTPVDRRVGRIKEITYLRWVDDIRIIAPTRGDAIAALQTLQSACQEEGLFLNSAKTQVLRKHSPEVTAELDVSDDAALSSIEEKMETRGEAQLREALSEAKKGLVKAELKNNDRMCRAYAGRVSEIGKFKPLREEAVGHLRSVALRQLKHAPGRADTWAKMLSPHVDKDLEHEICAILEDGNFNRYDWTNMWLCIVLSRAREGLAPQTHDCLRQILESSAHSFMVKAYALLALCRHGDDTDRRALANVYLAGNHPVPLRRAVVIGIQELATAQRNALYAGLTDVPELHSLVTYIEELKEPCYSYFNYPLRQCISEQTATAQRSRPAEGIGYVAGAIRNFPLSRRIAPIYD